MNNEEMNKMIKDAGITSDDTQGYVKYKFGVENDMEWKEEEVKHLIDKINEWKKNNGK
jgi:hypothetical protein